MGKLASLDTNLLVLLVVGSTDQRYVATHRRCKSYSLDDFKLLKELLTDYAELIITPNVASETSNLLAYVAEPARSEIATRYANILRRTAETYIPSSTATERVEFVRLGVTDSCLLELAARDIEVISDDLGLCLAAQQAGYATINFNHYRRFE